MTKARNTENWKGNKKEKRESEVRLRKVEE